MARFGEFLLQQGESAELIAGFCAAAPATASEDLDGALFTLRPPTPADGVRSAVESKC